MNKKLSPAQQILVAAIAGKTLTYRIVSLWRGGVSISSLVDVRIGGVKTEIKVRLSTIEALTNKGEVILTCVNPGSKEYTVVLPAPEAQEAEATPEAPEVEATEVEAHETTEVPEAPAPAPEAAGTETRVWPSGKKEMTKYGYCVVQVSGSKEHTAGHTCYRVLDYKPAALVGSCSPGIVCRASIPEEAIAAAKALEKIDIDMPRAWRASKIWSARIGLRKSKGVQTKTPAPTTPAPEALDEAKAARAETLAETEAITRYLIAIETDDSVHRHTLGTVLLAQGKKEEAKQVFLTLYESYRRDSRLQEAKQPLWEIILNCPDYAPTAYTLLGKLCEDLQQYPSAIVVYTHAITCIDGNEDYLYGLHRAYLAMGDEAQAAEYLKQARIVVDEREIAMGRCVPAAEVPEAKVATAAPEPAPTTPAPGKKIVSVRPLCNVLAAKEHSYLLLGKSCEDLEQYTDAIDIYFTALRDTGPCEDYLYGLYRAYLAMGEEAKAQEYLERARRLVEAPTLS